MRALVNGKMCEFPADVTANKVRKQLRLKPDEELHIEDESGLTKPWRDGENLKEGAKVLTVPNVTKG